MDILGTSCQSGATASSSTSSRDLYCRLWSKDTMFLTSELLLVYPRIYRSNANSLQRTQEARGCEVLSSPLDFPSRLAGAEYSLPCRHLDRWRPAKPHGLCSRSVASSKSCTISRSVRRGKLRPSCGSRFANCQAWNWHIDSIACIQGGG